MTTIRDHNRSAPTLWPSSRGMLSVRMDLLAVIPCGALVMVGCVERRVLGLEEKQSGPGGSPLLEAADIGAESALEVPAAPLPFGLVPRSETLEENGYYPCSVCHDGELQPLNTERRELEEEHTDIVLEHGTIHRWCYDCHNPDDQDTLSTSSTVERHEVSYDESHLLCAPCHSLQHREFVYGAHGKRVGNWRGERTLLNCTACHDPHSPAIKARAPLPPIPLRKGIGSTPRGGGKRHKPPVWERAVKEAHE